MSIINTIQLAIRKPELLIIVNMTLEPYNKGLFKQVSLHFSHPYQALPTLRCYLYGKNL